VLAQQVEKAFPGAVVTQPDGTKTISMDSLVAITIAAINQLASKVERFQATAAPALVTPPRLISPPTMGIDDAAMPWETFKTFRKNEVAEIEKYLSFDQAPTRARLIHIHGPPGIGKSTLIKLATKTLQDNYNVVIVLDCRSVSNLILSVTRAVEAFGGTCDKDTHQDVFRTLVVDRASLDFRILLIFENYDVRLTGGGGGSSSSTTTTTLTLAPYMADKPGLDVIFGSRKKPSAIDSCENPKPLPISCLSPDAAQSLFLHEASVDEKQLPEPEKAALRELVTEVLHGYPLSVAILGRIKRNRPQLELSKLLQHYKVKPDEIEKMAPKDPADHALLPQRVFDLLIDSIKDDVFTADASLSACYIFSFLDRVISNDLVVKVAETIQAPPPPSQLEPPDWLTPLLSCCVCYQHVQDGNSFYNMHPVLQDAFRTRLKEKSDDGYKQALKRATNSVFNIAGEGYTRGQWETVALHVKAIWNVPDSLSILADADIAARFVYLTRLLCTGVLNVEGM
jgi:energy-coupling factor transporter ATP-binding protein EcfA2